MARPRRKDSYLYHLHQVLQDQARKHEDEVDEIEEAEAL